jgi:hypothetical protein
MTLAEPQWLRSLRDRLPALGRTARAGGKWHGHPTVAQQDRRARPRLEALEDRLAPAVFNVNSTADLNIAAGVNPNGTIIGQGNTITLRSAIQAANAANGGSTIFLTGGTYRLTIAPNPIDDNSSGDLNITASVNLVGGIGGGTTVIDATGLGDRVFSLTGGPLVRVGMSNLRITGGSVNPNLAFGPLGGGIRSIDTNLALTNVTVTGNTAAGVGKAAGIGGGIYLETIQANFSLTNSTVSGNNADAGGGIHFQLDKLDKQTIPQVLVVGSTISGNSATTTGGGMDLAAGLKPPIDVVQVFNSTVSGNKAGISGGGFAVTTPDEVLKLTNVTVAFNQAGAGGGILILNGGGGVQLTNTLLAFNTPVNFQGLPAIIPSSNNNLDSDGSANLPGPTNLVANPLLLPLANNGGPTQTIALLPGSPAIDAGNDAAAVNPVLNPLATDQRGLPRIVGARSDIGAFELGLFVVSVSSPLPAGTYTPEQTIPINVTFSLPVIVNTAGGTPTLSLNTTPGATAVYASGSGTTTLTFAYTVANGQQSPRLDYTSPAALALNGATLTDLGGTAQVPVLPGPGAPGSLGANNNLVIEDEAGPPAVTTGGTGGRVGDGVAHVLTWSVADPFALFNVAVRVMSGATVVLTSTARAGTFDGTTLGAGTFTLTVTATDGDTDPGLAPLTATASFTIVVSPALPPPPPPPPPPAPVVTPPPAPVVTTPPLAFVPVGPLVPPTTPPGIPVNFPQLPGISVNPTLVTGLTPSAAQRLPSSGYATPESGTENASLRDWRASFPAVANEISPVGETAAAPLTSLLERVQSGKADARGPSSGDGLAGAGVEVNPVKAAARLASSVLDGDDSVGLVESLLKGSAATPGVAALDNVEEEEP